MKSILINRSLFYLLIYLFLLLTSLFVVQPAKADHDAVCPVVNSEGCCFMMVTTHGTPPQTYGPVQVCNAPTITTAPTGNPPKDPPVCFNPGEYCNSGQGFICCDGSYCSINNTCIALPPTDNPQERTIQGRHVREDGITLAPPPTGTRITVTRGSETQTSTSNPWSLSGFGTGTYTITAVPITDYGVSYRCTGGTCGNLTQGVWYMGNSFSHSMGNYPNIEIEFRYILRRTPPTPCLVTGAGDVNGDGYVTAADAELVIQHILGAITLTPAQIVKADVSGNGVISIGDVSGINAYINGIITTFPACTAATPTITATPTLPPGVTATPTPTVLVTPTPLVCTGTQGSQTVSGTIRIDTNGNNCTSGSTAYIGSAPTFRLYAEIQERAQNTYNLVTNLYTLTDTLACTTQNKSVVISSLPAEYRVVNQQMNGVWTGQSSYSATLPSNSNANVPLNWCVSTASSWFQTTSGDVRFPNLLNKVPAAEVGSKSLTSSPNTPGVFFSSQGTISTTTFGQGAVSASGWKVSDEYQYNDDFRNGLGGMSYTFFASQVRKRNMPTSVIPGSTFTFTSATTEQIYTKTGPLTITTSGLTTPGKSIVILVDGDVTISGPITAQTGQGNLIVVAASGDITVVPTVGTASAFPTTTLDGYFTAERNIILPSTANCATSTNDLRLNVSGALIANSLRPFATGGSGKIQNGRTLCSFNASFPALSVIARPEFLIQLTDFYKSTYKVYKELNP